MIRNQKAHQMLLADISWKTGYWHRDFLLINTIHDRRAIHFQVVELFAAMFKYGKLFCALNALKYGCHSTIGILQKRTIGCRIQYSTQSCEKQPS
jgi:hypothetical protein